MTKFTGSLLVLSIGLLAVFLIGCSAEPTPTPIPTAAPTATPTATPAPAPTNTPTATPTAAPTSTPAPEKVSLDDYITACGAAAAGAEDAFSTGAAESFDDVTYGDLSAIIAAQVEATSALLPPDELADWHNKRLEILEGFKVALDAQPADSGLGPEFILLLFGTAELQEELTQIESGLPAETRRRLIDSGCADSDDSAGTTEIDEPGTLLGTYAAGESARVGVYEITVTRASRFDGGTLSVRAEVRNVGPDSSPMPNCLSDMSLHGQTDVRYDTKGCARSGGTRDSISPGTTVTFTLEYENLPEDATGFTWQFSDGTSRIAFDLSPLLSLPVETDREALIALYNATGGANWDDNENWLSDRSLEEWCCIGWWANRGLVDVISLSLSDNGLMGMIPPELGNLASVTRLELSENQLSGPIPPELGNLVSLQSLDLYSNRLSGSIPPELGNLANLQGMVLSDNRLSGRIPPELGNLANLEWLYLDTNQLSGPIPPELGNLTSLDELYLAGNDLTGCIPDALMNVPYNDFDALGLPFCSQGSSTPSPVEVDRVALVALYNATAGEDWDDNTNWLSDEPIGEWYGVTTDGSVRVTELVLRNNSLVGVIPPQLGNLDNLQWLDLGFNELSGLIPPELGNLSKLEVLHLLGNQLSGSIPSELGSLSNLIWLHLNINRLSGPIPPELGSLSKLEQLDLNSSRLSGSIPPELGSLSNLKVLVLHGNQLSGKIPLELGSLSNLVSLYLSGNQLSGCVPDRLRTVPNNDLSQLGLSFCP